ncbi:MAG: chloride channel protein, partial [Calditrichaeota bacterium]
MRLNKLKKRAFGLSWLRQALINSDAHYKLGAIGFIVGITSGLAAIGLNYSLKFFHHHSHIIDGAGWKIFLPVAGLVLTVVLLKYFIKDFEGHGLPEVIHSISLKGGNIKFRSSFSKLLGSLVTISSGCSAGPEAPVTVSGAAIGSNIARFFKADEKVKVAVTGSGAAAAIAAIFNAPITGIIFTMEVIIGDWAPVYMLPVAIASVTGTEISRLLNGNQIPFTHSLGAVSLTDIVATIGLSIVCAIVSVLFIRMLRYTSVKLEKYFKNAIYKAAAGGLFIGLISFEVPHIRGEGYEFVQQLISGEFSAGIAMVFLIVSLKIIATSVTLGAGGAGGVFAPALVIGSSCGFLFYAIMHVVFPGLPSENYGLYALVGM